MLSVYFNVAGHVQWVWHISPRPLSLDRDSAEMAEPDCYTASVNSRDSCMSDKANLRRSISSSLRGNVKDEFAEQVTFRHQFYALVMFGGSKYMSGVSSG